jgi:hypothetical protein
MAKIKIENVVRQDRVLSCNRESSVSYPMDGNETCFQIEDDSFWFKHRNDCIIAAVKKYSPDKVFFDVGGGNGFVAKGLENNGIQTVLVEPGQQGCLNAKVRGLTNVICATLENASFKPASIDALGLFDVIEHLPPPC